MFVPKSIALVLDIADRKKQVKCKKELIEMFRNLDPEDALYIINENKDFFEKSGKIVVLLSRFKFLEKSLEELLDDAKLALDGLDDYEKIIFIITDNFNDIKSRFWESCKSLNIKIICMEFGTNFKEVATVHHEVSNLERLIERVNGT